MLLADLDSRFRAWLEAHDYLNGFGPRSVTVGGVAYLVPWHPPTPGCEAVFFQHDLDCLAGGTEADRIAAAARCEAGMLAVAARSWFLPRFCLRQAAPIIHDYLVNTGSPRFRRRATGPRSQTELMAELGYLTVPIT